MPANEVITAAEFRALIAAGDLGRKRRHKYGAKSIVIDGHRFPSLSEGRRYSQLRLLERAGAITTLKLQPRFMVGHDGADPIFYVADFEYIEKGARVVEDVKGAETPVYRIKKKLFKARFPQIDFREIKRRASV